MTAEYGEATSDIPLERITETFIKASNEDPARQDHALLAVLLAFERNMNYSVFRTGARANVAELCVAATAFECRSQRKSKMTGAAFSLRRRFRPGRNLDPAFTKRRIHAPRRRCDQRFHRQRLRWRYPPSQRVGSVKAIPGLKSESHPLLELIISTLI
jgi:hypothetical protein